MKKLLCVLMFGMVFSQAENSETVYKEPTTRSIADDIIQGWFESGLMDNCYIAIEGDHDVSDYEVTQVLFLNLSSGCTDWTYCITHNNNCSYLETQCRRYYDAIIQAMDCVFLKENSSVISNIQSQITSEIDRATTVETDLQSQINDLYDIINDDTGDENGDGWDDVCYEAGAQSGDLNLDGVNNVMDAVMLIDIILNP